MPLLLSPLAQAKLKHRLRFAAQLLHPPQFALCGAYHYENTGDMALAYAGLLHARERGAKMQTSANIAKWPGRPPTLVCGGAIVTNRLLDDLRARFGEETRKLAMIGVEISRRDEKLTAENRDFLNRLPFVSLRNTAQLSLVQDSRGNCSVRTTPDVVFSLDGYLRASRSNTVGINIVSGTGYDWTRSDAEEKQLKTYMRTFYRAAVERALDEGNEVEHLPFAISDDSAAREILEGMPVKFIRYDASVTRVLKRVASYSRFVPSRYHALIFGCLADQPMSPFLYARKNHWLFDDFIGDLNVLGFRNALGFDSSEKVRAFAERTISVPNKTLASLRDWATADFTEALNLI